MIDGTRRLHRLARTLEMAMYDHYAIEGVMEPMITIGQTTDSVTIQTEGSETEFFTVTVTHGRRPVASEVSGFGREEPIMRGRSE